MGVCMRESGLVGGWLYVHFQTDLNMQANKKSTCLLPLPVGFFFVKL